MVAFYEITCFKNWNRNIFRWIQLIFENQKFAIFDGFLYSFGIRDGFIAKVVLRFECVP